MFALGLKDYMAHLLPLPPLPPLPQYPISLHSIMLQDAGRNLRNHV
jgi:hypothetical protein